MDWYRHFAEILISGDSREVAAAAAAAADAERGGFGRTEAAAAGKAAARRFRGPAPVDTATASWSLQLAPRLFSPPARWGWEAVAPVTAEQHRLPAPPPRPVWAEPQRPDTTPLLAARSKALNQVVWRLAVIVVAAVAFTAYQLVIEKNVARLGAQAREVYQVVLIVVAGLLALSVIRALGGVRYANRNLREYERPFLASRAAEQQRYHQALHLWEETVRRHTADADHAAWLATRRATGPLWFPVTPASEPTRVDVFGGDPRRHGWASLLVTLGSSLLAAGHRITVLDFTSP